MTDLKTPGDGSAPKRARAMEKFATGEQGGVVEGEDHGVVAKSREGLASENRRLKERVADLERRLGEVEGQG